ncbi:probable protein S-acyltransferase 5 [Arachis stenosperma]|uniref:probable protein S-acyltransferase 5 n=1 Tax=Arachis stenosperma TaxID=217475 RepID=UPI0025ABB38A|nr:probable protein S-acyltransferase 5 [Arachis stenosperma]
MNAMMQPPPPPPPATSSGTGSPAAPSFVRTYRAWQGNNVFFLRGRLIFGPDVKSIFISVFLVIAPVALFCAFVARKLTHDFPHHAGWSIIVVVVVHTFFVLITLVLTSGRDPGIVPRSAYPPPPESDDDAASTRPRRSKIVLVNGVPVKVKYCDTCQLYRPLRCSHCSVCDNCVERFDHHCPWLGQCIGLRNYRFFYIFVLSSTLLCLYVHVFCWVYIKKIMDSEEKTIWKAMIRTPASIALIIYTFIWVWFVGGLTVFHTYLISTNQSTYENFKYRYDQQLVNPYDRGIVENFKQVFCTSIPPSKHNFRAKVPKDLPLSESQQRVVGGQSLSPMLKKTTENVVEERNVEHRRDGELRNVSQNESMSIHRESGEGQEASFFRQSLWERTSRKWEITPEVVTANSCSSGNSTQA